MFPLFGLRTITFTTLTVAVFFLLFTCISNSHAQSALKTGQYDVDYGTFIGDLRGDQASGRVFVASQTLFAIQLLRFATENPVDFYAGKSSSLPDISAGVKLIVNNGKIQKNRDVILRLPAGLSVADVRSLRLFGVNTQQPKSETLTINFSNLNVPRPMTIGPFKQFAHNVSSGPIQVLNTKQFLIPNLYYDGGGPDTYFWVGKSASGAPSPQGTIALYQGKPQKLSAFDGEEKSIIVTLPGDMTVKDINYLSLWCRKFQVNFAHVNIPNSLTVPPASVALDAEQLSNARLPTFANCERMVGGGRAVDISWSIQTSPSPYLYIQLEALLEPNEYMAFGLSGDTNGVRMKGGDVTVAFVTNERGNAIDYTLDDYAECKPNVTGACPDEELGGRNDVELLASNVEASSEGKRATTRVVYRKPLDRGDRKDIVIDVNAAMYTIWSIGPLNSKQQVSYHGPTAHAQLGGDTRLRFNRSAESRCSSSATISHMPIRFSRIDATPLPPSTMAPTTAMPRVASEAWQPAKLLGNSTNRRFTVVMGPAGGKRGYTGITGIHTWGIAYYINGLLIPELILQRGIKYEFVVFTGNDTENPTNYHPLYITTDPEGGFGQKTPEEQRAEKFLSGIERTTPDGGYRPTATGPLCEWKTPLGTDPEKFDTFADFKETLNLKCKSSPPTPVGQYPPLRTAGVLQFRPDASTPSLAYYQCYQHRNLGWKIRIVN